ncbi:hypothetical protein, partial [Klebsiella pneumoniae]|uniref:hypothetical protein n=1 Tax=Klebsiella pneumoniae TaxID=573 RepID=UPI0034E97314
VTGPEGALGEVLDGLIGLHLAQGTGDLTSTSRHARHYSTDRAAKSSVTHAVATSLFLAGEGLRRATSRPAKATSEHARTKASRAYSPTSRERTSGQ